MNTDDREKNSVPRSGEDLRDPEARYRLIVENAGEGIVVAQDGMLKLVNPKMQEMAGYSEEELTSRPFLDFVHTDDRELVGDYHRKRLKGELGPSTLYSFRVMAKDGSVKWMENRGTPATLEGRPATVNFLRDITEQVAADRALRDSEAKYRLVVDNAGEGILVAQDGMLKFVNPWMLAVGGYAEEDLLGKPFSQFVHPEDREMVYQQHLRRLKGELPTNHVYNLRVLTKNGGVLWMEMKGAPTTWEGRPASVNFVFDVTQRKLVDDGVRYRSAFEKLLMKLSTDFLNLPSDRTDSGIGRALRELGTFVAADRSYVFRFTEGGAKMSNTHEWCAEGVAAFRPDLQDVAVDAEFPWFAARIKAPAAVHIPSVADLPPEAAAEKREFERQSIQSMLCVPMASRHELVGFLGFDAVRARRTWSEDDIVLLRIAGEMLVNVLMRKQAEDALRSSEARFRSNFEQAAVGIIDSTLAGGYNWVNRRFCEITGYAPEELRTLTFRDITHPDDLAKELQDYQDALQGKTPSYSCEKRYVRKDRSLIWVQLSLSLVRDSDGVPRRFIGVVEDISYRRYMEEELFKAQKLESLGILAGGIAHDFNNMLTAIVSQIGMARMKLPPGDALAKRLEEVETAAFKARGLTQRLLTFARGGAPVKTTLALERVVRDAAVLVLSGASVTYTLSAGGDIWSVDADESQLGQAVGNLLINACQAMPGGGVIRIGLENCVIDAKRSLPLKPGNYVKLSVADEGAGIPPESLLKVFDPYYTTKEEGTGLGLAVCYSIVRNHGGHITADSAAGAGATFTVYLPASERAAAEARPADDRHMRGSGRVLVMDDEEMIRMVTGEILKELGYDVEFARDGGEAVERCRAARREGRPFDAVILDLTVAGGMGGKEAAAILSAEDPGVKAIVSSGYSNDPVMANFRDHGFRAVIVKPYKSVDLSRVLHSVIEGGAAG